MDGLEETLNFDRVFVYPNKKNGLNINHVFLAWGILITVILVGDLIFDFHLSDMRGYILVVAILAPIFTVLVTWNEYSRKKFKSTGELLLNIDEFQIDKQSRNWPDVTAIEFQINDYLGKRIRYPKIWSMGKACLSLGIDNYLLFTDRRERHEIRFAISSEQQMKALGELILELKKRNIPIIESYEGQLTEGLLTVVKSNPKEVAV